MKPKIFTLKFDFNRCYLIHGKQTIMIDGGPPGKRKSFLKQLRKLGVEPGEIKLIVLTHGDFDHIGSAKHFKEETSVQVAIHINDSPNLEKGISQLAAGITFIPGILTTSASNFHLQKRTKEEIYKQLDELVYKNFQVYGTCSQTTFSALNQVFSLDADNIVKALSSFSEIAMRGETCGAVSGCLLGIALVYEKDSESTVRPKLSAGPSINFCTRFENEFGSTRCRDVIQKGTKKEYQITKPEDYSILAQEGALNNCPEVVKKAVHIAADIILEKV